MQTEEICKKKLYTLCKYAKIEKQVFYEGVLKMSHATKEKHYSLGITALLVCAIIWGTSFVAQSLGGQYAEPFTFNCARNALATLFLIAISPLMDKLQGKHYLFWGTSEPALKRKLWYGASCSGTCLALALYMQQWGLMYTSAGKSGFITALYIVLVPILGLFVFHDRVSRNNWLGVFLAIIGMYFICITESFSVNKGDVLTLACPILFSIQILIIDFFISDLDPVRFSTVQFGSCTIISGLMMLLCEQPSWEQITSSIGPILYLAIMSSGIAYTLQIVGQKYVNSVIASMLMSLEAVFALLSGWIYLGQTLTLRELSGCLLMFVAIILAQLPDRK